ncbi:hypothetical protein LLE49_23955 [Alicyclobacillus tolerans]|uniref:hypothetical protein n=1 Tax=Alicyclobacillus tolerans TaxID=90970 RepID=UPI001F29ABCF|nr:hypothetical protein [Alicyclobacillus tolerans]MCF8567780.1 hypothetical protein [Alicyclobacillus tolerans]
MKNFFRAALILIFSSGLLAGCNTSGANLSSVHNGLTNTVDSTSNSIVDSNVASSTTYATGKVMKSTNSKITDSKIKTSKNTMTPDASPSQKKNVHTDSGSESDSSHTSSSIRSSKSTSNQNISGASKQSVDSNSSSRGASDTQEASKSSSSSSTSSRSKSGVDTSTSPTSIAVEWTNMMNKPFLSQNYSGPNSSLYDTLVTRMAEGKISSNATKSTILSLNPWDTIWTSSNEGDGKEYQFIVHDVGAFTYHTKVLNYAVTSQEWQAHGQEILDDSFYSKWAVYWDASTQEYNVAFLDVGFYLQSVK